MITHTFPISKPVSILDKKALERIQLKQFRKEIEDWVKLDPKYRHTFVVLEKVRDSIEK